MLADEVRSFFEKRAQLHIEDYWNADKYRAEAVKILSRNISETICFLDSDCSASDLSWMSEIFEDIIDMTRSTDFIAALYRAAERFPDACRTYNIVSFIKDAESHLRYLEEEEPLNK